MSCKDRLTKKQIVEQEQSIVNFFTGWLKECTGKGPKNTQTKICSDRIEVFVEGFLTTLEKHLMEDYSNLPLIQEVRAAFYGVQIDHLSQGLSKIIKKDICVAEIEENILGDYVKIILKLE